MGEVLYNGRLSGVTFEGRQEAIAQIGPAKAFIRCALHESKEWDGIEVFAVTFRDRSIEPRRSLGWIPAQPKDENKQPGPASPLCQLRHALRERNLTEQDEAGFYVGPIVEIATVGLMRSKTWVIGVKVTAPAQGL